MKKIVFAFVFLFSLVFLMISCGDGSDSGYPVEDQEDADVREAADADVNPETDEDKAGEPDETAVDEEADSDSEPEQPEEEPAEPATNPIGNFSLNFSGPVNTTISMQSRGGKGAVNFTYNGMPTAFQEINVMNIDIFPLAMVNSGNIIVLWLDSFSLGDISGTSEKQVFGISMPQSAAAGSGTMKDINSYAFYGDITVNIKGGAFNVKCVRAVSDSGSYNLTSNDGSNIAFSAEGNLFDPALAGSMIPYPACE